MSGAEEPPEPSDLSWAQAALFMGGRGLLSGMSGDSVCAQAGWWSDENLPYAMLDSRVLKSPNRARDRKMP